MRQRHGLIARVVQMRRGESASDTRPDLQRMPLEQPTVQSLEARVAHLEGMMQGFQDSVHRESTRQSRRIAELEARMEPAALAVALSQDARDRGL